MDNYYQKTLGELTLSEFADLLNRRVPEAESDSGAGSIQRSGCVEAKKHYVYGLKGLADLLGCCKQTAYNIKRSGKIAPAVRQVGRLLIIDADLALELASKKTGGRRISPAVRQKLNLINDLRNGQ